MQDIAETDEPRESRKITTQWASLWMVPVTGFVLLIAFMSFPGFFPPMSPGMTAGQVSVFYRENQSGIRFSMIIYNLCGVMLVPFFMVIVVHMKRMETPSHVFAYSYLTAAANGATLFAIADLLWLIGAFRPGRPPDLTMLLNDMAWIIFTAPVGMIVVMNICLALAIFFDAHPKPIYPRWVAYLNLLTAAAIAPSACAAVFRSGPLAWNGFVSFWLRIGAFSLYIMVMFFVARADIKRQAMQQRAPHEEMVAQ